jgi:hypothetical protein
MIEATSGSEYKYQKVFAIVRLDLFLVNAVKSIEDIIVVKKIVWTFEKAEAEVDRLNALNGDKGVLYFWRGTRLERKDEQTLVSD